MTESKSGRGRSWAQRQRLALIDQALESKGMVRRQDLVEAFGISLPQATTDLAEYERVAPGNMTYDTRAKAWRRTPSFRRRFSGGQAVAWVEGPPPGAGQWWIAWTTKEGPAVETVNVSPPLIGGALLLKFPTGLAYRFEAYRDAILWHAPVVWPGLPPGMDVAAAETGGPL